MLHSILRERFEHSIFKTVHWHTFLEDYQSKFDKRKQNVIPRLWNDVLLIYVSEWKIVRKKPLAGRFSGTRQLAVKWRGCLDVHDFNIPFFYIYWIWRFNFIVTWRKGRVNGLSQNESNELYKFNNLCSIVEALIYYAKKDKKFPWLKIDPLLQHQHLV